MYGSFLNFQTINLIHPFLISAFGSQYYVFDKNTQLCISQINIGHESNVICSTVFGNKNQYILYSLDSLGLFIKAEIKFQMPESDQQCRSEIKLNVLQKSVIVDKRKKEIGEIKSGTFVDKNCILLINNQKKLERYDIENQSFSHLAYQSSFSQIKHNKQESFVFLIEQDQQGIKLYSKQSHSLLQNYKHHIKVTSCASANQIFIIGDSKGKITLIYDFFNTNKNRSKNQRLTSTLEWHTGPVLSLCSNGQYIYSAGEQSVVVLWHIRDLSRDFLPRVRTSINYLTVNIQTNEILCGLSDNSIKIIDLSRDKETRTFRTVIDPKGYAPNPQPRFSNKTTNYKDGLVCLNSVPGKIQFLNLNKNGENIELQIVPRNLINSINEDRVSPHRISSISFSSNWSVMLTSLQVNSSSSYLKFYFKGVQGYQLVNKIQNPHIGLTKACLSIENKKSIKFLTYSLTDRVIRVWEQHRQKKKSIIDASEVFWRHSEEIKYRNLFPSFISSYKNFVLILFNNTEILLYELKQSGVIESIQTISTENKIEQAFIIEWQLNKQKRNFKLLLVTKQMDFQVMGKSQQKKEDKMNIYSQIHMNKKASSFFITAGPKQIVIIAKVSQKSSQILFLDRKTFKFTQIFNSDTAIQSAFWAEDRLMLITEDLTISSLDGQQFIKFPEKDSVIHQQMSEQTNEVGQEIFKINSRWIERQSIRNKKKTLDNLQGLGLFPNCISAWEQISSKLLI